MTETTTGPTKAELLERARALEVDGRSKMDVDELAAAIADAEAARQGDLQPGTPDEVGRPELVHVAQTRAANRKARRRVIGDAGEEA